MDPFIHRSVQATNDNFKLLFEYRAAEFSLAPLGTDEQLKLIDDAITYDEMFILHYNDGGFIFVNLAKTEFISVTRDEL